MLSNEFSLLNLWSSSMLRLPTVVFWIEFLSTVRTNAVTDFYGGVLNNVPVQISPTYLFVSYLFAGSAYDQIAI